MSNKPMWKEWKGTQEQRDEISGMNTIAIQPKNHPNANNEFSGDLQDFRALIVGKLLRNNSARDVLIVIMDELDDMSIKTESHVEFVKYDTQARTIESINDEVVMS